MSKQIPNVFEKMSLRHWYKYLLYITGILLIVSLIFGSDFDQTKVINYSITVMGVSLFLWIMDDILKYVDSYYVETTSESYRSEYYDKIKILIIFREIVHFIAFFSWILITVRTFF